MENGPWRFDKALLLMREFDGEKVKDICLKEANFWVRIHDLPLMARNEFVGKEVGKSFGEIVKVGPK